MEERHSDSAPLSPTLPSDSATSSCGVCRARGGEVAGRGRWMGQGDGWMQMQPRQGSGLQPGPPPLHSGQAPIGGAEAGAALRAGQRAGAAAELGAGRSRRPAAAPGFSGPAGLCAHAAGNQHFLRLSANQKARRSAGHSSSGGADDVSQEAHTRPQHSAPDQSSVAPRLPEAAAAMRRRQPQQAAATKRHGGQTAHGGSRNQHTGTQTDLEHQPNLQLVAGVVIRDQPPPRLAFNDHLALHQRTKQRRAGPGREQSEGRPPCSGQAGRRARVAATACR